ncbi:hypothetical protein EGR_07875 [Echinococcus granulosus]|uniref:Uncharacterized protein n=1 Tax=Echinococcus granulosus TaxID=6210 RepID=W6U7W5_ECHGR|nr:hypothetical protein EGR_07875 [Echinococcus granulosus]EUB57265.1 hypothetical protein EGR_07875 [Echinococcus granulosus]
MESTTDSFTPPTEALASNQTQNWLKLFRFSLQDDESTIFFILICIIIGLGVIFNLTIFILCTCYKRKYWRRHDLYTSNYIYRISDMLNSMQQSELSSLVKTDATRPICFLAMAIQARLRYMHIIYMNALFNLAACSFFLPFVAMRICDYKNVEWIHSDQFLFLCQALSVFQVNFLSFTLLVNTSIVFVSTVFPPQFTLKKTSFVVLLAIILLLCLVHMTCALILTINRMSEGLFSAEESSFENRVEALKIVLIVTLGVFIGTFVFTVILQFLVHCQICSARSYLDYLDDRPVVDLWIEILRDCSNHAIILFLASLVFYALETPAFLLIYNIISSHWWILLCHCSVHMFNALIHLPLCSQLRHPFDKSTARACREECHRLTSHRKHKTVTVSEIRE